MRLAVLVVVEAIVDENAAVGLVAFSFVSVTMQYDTDGYHGLQSRFIEGFQAANSSGVIVT